MTIEEQAEQDAAEMEQEHGNWEFIGRAPTVEEVGDLLLSLPPVWGVSAYDFAAYIQALPQKKKILRPHPERPGVMVREYVEAFTLYMSVAGRQAMLRAAQEAEGWRVDYRPEPNTPTGVPGYLSFKDRLVFRVYVDVYVWETETRNPGGWTLLGSRFGTAWVPESGGSQAAGSNPYEKVETSALGRAIGAWGFGVLPGSGIATVEEMAAIQGNAAALSVETHVQPGSRRETREELLESTLTTVEAYRQEARLSEEEMIRKTAAFLVQQLGIRNAFDEANVAIVWDAVKDGQLVMLRQKMQEGIRRLRIDEGA